MGRVPIKMAEHSLQMLSHKTLALISCSLVCRTWAPVAQRRIFSEVHLPVNYLRLFHQLMASSPHLSAFVKILLLYGRSPSTGVVFDLHLIPYLPSAYKLEIHNLWFTDDDRYVASWHYLRKALPNITAMTLGQENSLNHCHRFFTSLLCLEMLLQHWTIRAT